MLSSYYVTILISFLTGVPLLDGAVFFPSNSAYGIFAAIAVPLDLGPHRNVYVSYNFEANYNLPINWQVPTYLNIVDTRRLKNRIENEKQTESKNKKEEESKAISDEVDDADADVEETTISANSTIIEIENENEKDEAKSRERRSLLSRRSFYKILKQKLQMHGFDGKGCLLRMICETNASAMGDINGFLGSVIHIIFTPSTSKDEGISDSYYKAEFNGKHSTCESYEKECPENILDFISTPLHEITTKK